MTSRLAHAVAGLALAMAIAGCSAQAPAGSRTPSPSDRASNAPVTVPAASQAPTPATTSAVDRETAPQAPDPTTMSSLRLDAHATKQASAVATRVVRLYLHRDVTAERWYADLEPYLSATAAEDYQGTQPYKLPRASVAGMPARIVKDSQPLLARVQVPTSGGAVTVVVSRTVENPQTWQVERIILPENLEG